MFFPYSSAYSCADRLERQLARAARRDEAAAELVRDRGADEEAARLSPDDDVRLALLGPVGEQVDRLPERLAIGEQRHDVLEDDALLRPVGNVADLRFQPVDAGGGHQLDATCFRARQKSSCESSWRELGERAKIVERRLAPLRVARAQRRRDELLEQRGLPVGGRAEGAQVARPDPERRELGADRGDLGVAGRVALLRAVPASLERPYSSSSRISCGVAPERSRSSVALQLLLGARQTRPLAVAVATCRPQARPAPAGSRAAAGTRHAGGAGSSAGARPRPRRRGGSRPASASARAGPGPRGSGSSRSRRPGTRRAGCRQTAPMCEQAVPRGCLGCAALTRGRSACTCRSAPRRRPRAGRTRSGGG